MQPLPSIAGRLDGETLLLTGGTGFVARSLLERILSEAAGVRRIYLLIRPRGRRSAAERLRDEVHASAVFEGLRSERSDFDGLLEEKLVAVAGDLTSDRLGMDPDVYATLCSEVTLVLHCAASCSFDEPLDHALGTNTLGTRRVLRFAQDASSVPLIHLSTCYVGATTGARFPEAPIEAGWTPIAPLAGFAPAFELEEEISRLFARCTEARDGADPEAGDRDCARLGRDLARERGWNDVYQLSKALGEMVLSSERGEVPVRVVRPSIIGSTFEHPRPGWVEGVRMADPMILGYGRGMLPTFVGRDETVLDMVPCDMVANLVLAAVPPRNAPPSIEVVHLASGSWNPLRLGELLDWMYEAFGELSRRPGSPLPVPPRRARLLPEGAIHRHLRQRRVGTQRLLQRQTGRGDAARGSAAELRRLSTVERMVELYAFYTCTSPSFEVSRTRELLERLSTADRSSFSFDVGRVEWCEYVRDRHIPGLLLARE